MFWTNCIDRFSFDVLRRANDVKYNKNIYAFDSLCKSGVNNISEINRYFCVKFVVLAFGGQVQVGRLSLLNCSAHCSLAPWPLGILVPLHLGTLATWLLGTLATWLLGTLASWHLGILAP